MIFRIVVADVDVVATRALEALARRPGAIAFARARLPRMAARGVLPASWSASHRRGPQREGGTADARGTAGVDHRSGDRPETSHELQRGGQAVAVESRHAPRVEIMIPPPSCLSGEAGWILEKRQNWVAV